MRGDLWSDAAIAPSSGLTSEVADAINPQMTKSTDRARTVAERAGRLSPHESRIWLLLAALDSGRDRPNPEIANRLKMSYYTGPDQLALSPLRIRVATRSRAIADTDLQALVAQEIRTIIFRHQDQKPALLAAYRDARLRASNSSKRPSVISTKSAIDDARQRQSPIALCANSCRKSTDDYKIPGRNPCRFVGPRGGFA